MDFWALATLWFFLALFADFVAIRFKIAVALSEILIGMAAACTIGYFLPDFATIGASENWIVVLANSGAVLLTFLAGTELEPKVLIQNWKAGSLIGLSAFFAPFLGCAAVAYYFLQWSFAASLLAGICLSTTSVAIIYAVLLELGLNRTQFGKFLLSACFINGLATLLALGLMFEPFTYKTIIFLGVCLLAFIILPKLSAFCFKRWGQRHSQLELKLMLFFLFGLGSLAYWCGSEPVLPAYIMGIVLATLVDKDHTLVQRLRGLTFSFLTPFYFLRAGSFVSIPALIAAPLVFLVLFAAKMLFNCIGIYPATILTKHPKKEGIYMTLLMSTGLTFGTIAALYGLTHAVIDQSQYTYLVAAVIASAVIPTIIANAFYLPKHLIQRNEDAAPELPKN
jgi:glutathione-regulated potassium-efflux system ancillary protein KefC